MKTVSVAETKAHLSELLVNIERGEEIVITRRGKPIARLAPILQPKKPVPSLAKFRSRLPCTSTSASKVLQMLREESK